MVQPKTGRARLQKTLDAIVRSTLELPEVVESTAYGQPALKRKDKLIFALRKDLETLALVCSFEDRAALMTTHPDTYFITDHYLNWPSVVVRLENADLKILRRAVKAAWERAGASAPRRRPSPGRRRTTRAR